MAEIQVETFEETEVSVKGTVESEAEAVTLAEKLGLKGQAELVTRDNDGQKTRCPYHEMTVDELFTYSEITPAHVDVKGYSAGPIPLRVLQVLAHVNEAEFFKNVQVWAAESAAVQDPVLVGIKDGWPQHFYLLARWGRELDSFEKLFKRACKAWKARVVAELQTAQRKIQGDIALIESITDEGVLSIRSTQREVVLYSPVK